MDTGGKERGGLQGAAPLCDPNKRCEPNKPMKPPSPPPSAPKAGRKGSRELNNMPHTREVLVLLLFAVVASIKYTPTPYFTTFSAEEATSSFCELHI